MHLYKRLIIPKTIREATSHTQVYRVYSRRHIRFIYALSLIPRNESFTPPSSLSSRLRSARFHPLHVDAPAGALSRASPDAARGIPSTRKPLSLHPSISISDVHSKLIPGTLDIETRPTASPHIYRYTQSYARLITYFQRAVPGRRGCLDTRPVSLHSLNYMYVRAFFSVFFTVPDPLFARSSLLFRSFSNYITSPDDDMQADTRICFFLLFFKPNFSLLFTLFYFLPARPTVRPPAVVPSLCTPV